MTTFADLPNASTALSGFEVYKTYLALSLHFKSEKYDYIQYNGKCRASANSYKNSSYTMREKMLMEKLGKKFKKDELENFFISNFVYAALKNNQPLTHINEFSNPDTVDIYIEWKKNNESLKYRFETDCDWIADHIFLSNKKFSDVLKPDNGSFPAVVRLMIDRQISIETVTILNRITDFIDKGDINIHDSYWNMIKFYTKKYAVFFRKETILECKSIIKKRIISTNGLGEYNKN